MKPVFFRRALSALVALMLLLPCAALGAENADTFAAAPGEAPQNIRVLLTRLGGKQRLDMTLNGSYSAETDGASLMFGRGADITVLLIDSRLYLYYMDVRVDAGTSLTLKRHPVESGTVNGVLFANNLSIYEGDLQLTATEGAIRMILTIGTEDYVKGVVPYEMSESFPLEALKAQAVAARTYAVSKALLNRKNEYDVVDNTNDQSYRGRRDSNVQAGIAVDATTGVCGFYKDNLAMCYYSASNGGQTELAEHVWGKEEARGYLDMRDDPYDLENPQSKVQSVQLPKKSAEVADTPYVLRLLLSHSMADVLTGAGYDATPESLRVDSVTAVSVDTPLFAEPSRLYSMLHITFTYSARTRTEGESVAADGPVVSETTPTPATQWLDEDEEVSLFTPEPNAQPIAEQTATPEPTQTPMPTPSPTPVPSYGPFVKVKEPVTLDIPIFPDAEKWLSLGINSYDNEMVTVTEDTDNFTIESRRFGHGVGMSQRGAEWMAGKYGKTYTEILAFYYPGMTLMRYAETDAALTTVQPALMQTAGPVPTPTPQPTLMPVTQALPVGAWYAEVTEIDDDSSLNLRSAPDTTADVLMRLYKHQQLVVLENCPQEGWVRVRTDVVEGYVMEKFLTQTNEQ